MSNSILTMKQSSIQSFALSRFRACIMESSNSCAYCNKSSVELLRCSGCRNAFYCSKECQRAHWKTHKQQCTRTVSAAPAPSESEFSVDNMMSFIKHYVSVRDQPQVREIVAQANLGEWLSMWSWPIDFTTYRYVINPIL